MEGNENQHKLNPHKVFWRQNYLLGDLVKFDHIESRLFKELHDSPLHKLVLLTNDYYKVLGVDYDATDEKIRISYRKLALKWHPDKHKGNDEVTAKFQLINEAYTVLSDPAKRLDYDLSGNIEIDQYTLGEYLTRFKGMILTCNGLGMSHSSTWSQQLTDSKECPKH